MFLQPSTVSRYASKVLAAHVGMLQSEALVLQYQRQHVEAELQKLQAKPGFLHQQQPQEGQDDAHQLDWLHPLQQRIQQLSVEQHVQGNLHSMPLAGAAASQSQAVAAVSDVPVKHFGGLCASCMDAWPGFGTVMPTCIDGSLLCAACGIDVLLSVCFSSATPEQLGTMHQVECATSAQAKRRASP
jgi:hypothetical protein